MEATAGGTHTLISRNNGALLLLWTRLLELAALVCCDNSAAAAAADARTASMCWPHPAQEGFPHVLHVTRRHIL